MGDRKFGIAYLDRNGTGFSLTEPFVEADFDSIYHANEFALNLLADEGCKQITIFEYSGELPKYVSWNYVTGHYRYRLD